VRGTSASAGTMRGAATGAPARMSALVDIVTRYRMRVRVPTTSRRAVTLATRSTTASTV
jgi:hypothetical protein